jgi:transposase
MDAEAHSKIEAEVAHASSQIAKLERERDEYKKLVRLLQEENERLKRGLLGQKAERLPRNDAQLSLAILDLMLGGEVSPSVPEPPPAEEQTVAEHTRRQPKRKALPETLPRVAIEIVPPEVQREGLDAFELIGTDVREVLERRPASSVVVQLIYKKFVRKDRTPGAPTEVLSPETVELPIERGLAGPGMLADRASRRPTSSSASHIPIGSRARA